ncbi:16774_t:CDS:2, partial [Dentiscutata heterogama]
SVVRERSFYASLHRQIHSVSENNITNQPEIQEPAITSEFISNSEVAISKRITFTKDDNSNEELSANADKESNANGDEESDRIESLASFFHEIERDVKQNTQLLSAFEKFQKGYHNAKNLSENKLVSFVYQHASSSATIR